MSSMTWGGQEPARYVSHGSALVRLGLWWGRCLGDGVLSQCGSCMSTLSCVSAAFARVIVCWAAWARPQCFLWLVCMSSMVWMSWLLRALSLSGNDRQALFSNLALKAIIFATWQARGLRDLMVERFGGVPVFCLSAVRFPLKPWTVSSTMKQRHLDMRRSLPEASAHTAHHLVLLLLTVSPLGNRELELISCPSSSWAFFMGWDSCRLERMARTSDDGDGVPLVVVLREGNQHEDLESTCQWRWVQRIWNTGLKTGGSEIPGPIQHEAISKQTAKRRSRSYPHKKSNPSHLPVPNPHRHKQEHTQNLPHHQPPSPPLTSSTLTFPSTHCSSPSPSCHPTAWIRHCES